MLWVFLLAVANASEPSASRAAPPAPPAPESMSASPAPAAPGDLLLTPPRPIVFILPFSEALDDELTAFVRTRARAAEQAAEAPALRSRTDLYLSTDAPRALPARVGQAPGLDLRTAGSVDLAPGLRLEGVYTAFDTLGDARVGRIELRDPQAGRRGPAGGVDILEARLGLEVARAGSLALDFVGGVRASVMDYLPAYTPEVAPLNIEPEPIVGASLRWDVLRRLSLSASAVAAARDPEGLTDLTVDARWRVSRAAELSVGYQMMRGTFEQQSVSGQVQRDAVVVQLKLSF